EQMNMQILYLLGIGKFYTYNYANNANGQTSNTMSSVLSSTLSGQLNNMFSQIINSNNWNFGTTLSTGDKGWTDVEVEGMLSGQLLNNRLLINGNFGYRDNPMANTNFVGDFDIEYLLTKSGDIRLKAYNQTNDRYYAKTTLSTQGIGIIYKKDFNTWRDLLFWQAKTKRTATKQVQDSTITKPQSRLKREK
ncbi:MAG: translocation/assembly module TamB domain-containing protein, partial [Bacteroides sp.]